MSIEIMSPVGSYESLMAAIQAGAGSVYFGVGKMNMRSRSAANFDYDDLQQLTQICKEHQVRSYLTVNTIVYNDEVEEMKKLVDLAKKCEVSAIIASDWAVIQYCRKIGMEVHISTQCNITNIEAVRFYAQFADVLVLAREVSLAQAADICQTIREENICGPSGQLIQIEMFVHGALCMAVSGKCYLSLDNMGYSANRGACMQLCRRKYTVKDTESDLELEVDGKYIMSPKDLCTIGFLDKIIKAGVTVLKIEGRGRSAEDVNMVTACYHEALRSVFNRGFWDGYYLGRTMGEWSERYGSQATRVKSHIGKITNYYANIGVAEIIIESDNLQLGDQILICGPTTGVYEDTLQEIRVDLKPCEKAEKGVYCSITTKELVRRGDKVYKWVEVADEF